MQPLISVIVPVYNTEKYLNKCVDSIINQTYKNLEIFLVDDGSTDNSGKICDDYEKKDERIKVIHKENGGQSTARNAALDIAKGEYIAFVDSDDWLHLNMYEVMYNEIEKNNADIAICGRFNVFDDRIETFFTYENAFVLDAKEALKRLLIYDGVDSAPWDKLTKREVYNDIRFPHGYICEDVDVIYKVIDRARKLVHCGQPLYYYYQREGSTSRDVFAEKTMGIKIYHKNAYEFAMQKYPELLMEAQYFYYSRLLVLYRRMVESNYFSHHYKAICRDIRINFLYMLNNKFLSKQDKKDSRLIFLGLYVKLKNVRRYLKSILKKKR